MTLTSNLTTKIIPTLTNFWTFSNFSIFPNIIPFSLIPPATPLIFSSHNLLSNPLVFLLTQSPSLITILCNLLFLPTPLNSPLLDKTLFIQLLSASFFDSSSFTDVDDFVFALDSLLTNTLNVLLPL